MLLKQPNIISLIAASAILITINKAQTIANDDGGELDTFELDCDENELDCDFYDEDDDDDYEDEFYDYSGDGEELPDSVQPIPFNFGGEEDVSVNDFVRRIKAPKPPRKLKDKTSRKLGVVYNGWKAASRMLQHIVTNTELDRKRFIRKLLNYGCHCFPGTKSFRQVGGKGPSMDSIDGVCKQQFQCHRCLKIDSGCDADKTGYRAKFIGKRRSVTRDVSCHKNREGTCARQLCECDKHMAYTMKSVWNDTLHDNFYWLDKRNKKQNQVFEYENTCIRKQNGNNANANKCCGNWPKVIPFNDDNRACCVGTDVTSKPRIFDDGTHECCDGRLTQIGEC